MPRLKEGRRRPGLSHPLPDAAFLNSTRYGGVHTVRVPQFPYSGAMATTTIQVSREVRDHLAALAKERGLSLGQLVEALAAEQPTAAQRAERLAADREVVRRLIGIGLSDGEFDEAPDVLGNIYKIAAAKARAAKATAA